MDMMTHPEKYPQEKGIEDLFRKAKSKIIWIEAEKIAAKVGLPMAENMVLLGALSFVSSFDKEFMLEVLKKSIPREIKKNIAAFNEGYKAAEGI